MVFWIFCGNFSHGVAIGDQARPLRRALVIVVQLSGRRQVRAFAITLCTHSRAAIYALPPRLQLALIFHPGCKRITPISKRDSPVRDSARRVLSQDSMESLYEIGRASCRERE